MEPGRSLAMSFESAVAQPMLWRSSGSSVGLLVRSKGVRSGLRAKVQGAAVLPTREWLILILVLWVVESLLLGGF